MYAKRERYIFNKIGLYCQLVLRQSQYFVKTRFPRITQVKLILEQVRNMHAYFRAYISYIDLYKSTRLKNQHSNFFRLIVANDRTFCATRI